MQHPKETAWGAGIMGIAGLVRAVLGPSPLVLPFVPLISLAHLSFAVAAAAIGMPSGLGELGVAGKAILVSWSAVLGSVAGRLLGAWRGRRGRSTVE